MPRPSCCEAVGVRVIPERAGIRRREFVGETLARPDRRLRDAGHSVHRFGQPDAVCAWLPFCIASDPSVPCRAQPPAPCIHVSFSLTLPPPQQFAPPTLPHTPPPTLPYAINPSLIPPPTPHNTPLLSPPLPSPPPPPHTSHPPPHLPPPTHFHHTPSPPLTTPPPPPPTHHHHHTNHIFIPPMAPPAARPWRPPPTNFDR